MNYCELLEQVLNELKGIKEAIDRTNAIEVVKMALPFTMESSKEFLVDIVKRVKNKNE